MTARSTMPERMATVEAEVREVRKHQASFERKQDAMDAKLDDLLALRHKGIGAFWLASMLTGTGIIGGASLLWDWITR